MRIPEQTDHLFLTKPITDSSGNRSQILAQADRRFLSKPITFDSRQEL
jgi:hypothetical protein